MKNNINIDRAFIDMICGAVGIICLFICLYLLSGWVNAKIYLNIDAKKEHGKYPLFVDAKGKNLKIICKKDYLPREDLQEDLLKMCHAMEDQGILSADPEYMWKLFGTFIDTKFDKNNFFIFVLIRPSGVEAFQRKLEPVLLEHKMNYGSTPIPETWEFKIRMASK